MYKTYKIYLAFSIVMVLIAPVVSRSHYKPIP